MYLVKYCLNFKNVIKEKINNFKGENNIII